MHNKSFLLGTAAIVAAFAPAMAMAAPALLRSVHPLDDERGYCIDIAGFRETLRIDEPLQAHTCKYGTPLEDQLFESIPRNGAIKAAQYDRCLAAAALEPGANVLVRACANRPAQRWRLSEGRLSPESRPDLCASLAESGEAAGTPVLISPVYRRRDLSLESCESTMEARQTFRWSHVDEREAPTANVARAGMPEDVAAGLAAFGHEFDGEIAGQTAALYAPLPRVYEPAEIEVAKDLAYGPHERQRIDIHTARLRRAERPMPVIVVFHGGGLIGGDRAATANVADYFASLGYVGVNGGYRLAPESRWPEGGRDVAAAVTWLRDHVAEYGGDPEGIFVAGISTGAFHAATFVFRPELMPSDALRPAGAILVSGPYAFDFAAPSRGELAYFGEDPSRWPEMVVPGNVTRADIPVLFTTAEWDNARYTTAFAELFSELVLDHGVVPRYKQSLGHNHSSQLLSVGTADTSVSSEIVDFIERTSKRYRQ